MRAGNIKIFFPSADFTVLQNYFAAGKEYALLRFTLSGTDLDPTVTPPILCADIAGNPANDKIFTNPAANWNDVVDLEEINVEGEERGSRGHIYITLSY